MGLGDEARIDLSIADVSNLETTVAAPTEQVDSIVGGMTAQVEIGTGLAARVASEASGFSETIPNWRFRLRTKRRIGEAACSRSDAGSGSSRQPGC